MDPNAALTELREIAQTMESRGNRVIVNTVMIDKLDRMVELVRSLDEWLSRGGFPPEEWREGPDALPAPGTGSDGECHVGDRDDNQQQRESRGCRLRGRRGAANGHGVWSRDVPA